MTTDVQLTPGASQVKLVGLTTLGWLILVREIIINCKFIEKCSTYSKIRRGFIFQLNSERKSSK